METSWSDSTEMKRLWQLEISTLLRYKAKSGELGWKAGKGSYSYGGEKKKPVMDSFIRNLAKQLKMPENYKRD